MANMRQWVIPADEIRSDAVAYTAAAAASLTQVQNAYIALVGANVLKYRQDEILDTINWLKNTAMAAMDGFVHHPVAGDPAIVDHHAGPGDIDPSGVHRVYHPIVGIDGRDIQELLTGLGSFTLMNDRRDVFEHHGCRHAVRDQSGDRLSPAPEVFHHPILFLRREVQEDER